MKIPLTIMIEQEEKEKLIQLAEAFSTSQAAVVRRLIRAAMFPPDPESDFMRRFSKLEKELLERIQRVEQTIKAA